MFISITRLRLRSVRFAPRFAFMALRSLRQARAAAGFQGGSVLADRRCTFWTMSAWDSEQSMRGYMTMGDHRTAMPHLLDWCDQASVVHWERPESGLPPWPEADSRMRRDGRPSKVRFPAPDHAAMTFQAPRVASAAPIRPTASRPSSF